MVVTILSLPFLLTDCTTKVVDDPIAATADRPGGQVLPRPRRVFVADFQIDPQAVQQDQGIGPSAIRAMGQGPAAYGTAQQVQDAVASSLSGEHPEDGVTGHTWHSRATTRIR
jgi:hypothetical protein